MILDTNALSAFLDGIPSVVSQLGKAETVHLPVVVMGEYRYGLRGARKEPITLNDPSDPKAE